MQPDEFYRLPELQRFIAAAGAPAVRTVVDIGANVGDLLLLLHRYFPQARIIGFEPVAECFETAVERTAAIDRIEIRQNAVTGDHLYFDDLGERPRPCRMALTIANALPESGEGWRGGSLVGPSDLAILAAGVEVLGYRRSPQPVEPVTLAEIVADIGADDIDLLKLDCEGCEASVLGTADLATLRRVRFITGEYHNLGRFYRAIRHRLFQTHRVWLGGGSELGAFFAERRDGGGGARDGALLLDRTMRVRRAPGSDDWFEWNPFRGEWPRWRAAAARLGIRSALMRPARDLRPGCPSF